MWTGTIVARWQRSFRARFGLPRFEALAGASCCPYLPALKSAPRCGCWSTCGMRAAGVRGPLAVLTVLPHVPQLVQQRCRRRVGCRRCGAHDSKEQERGVAGVRAPSPSPTADAHATCPQLVECGLGLAGCFGGRLLPCSEHQPHLPIVRVSGRLLPHTQWCEMVQFAG